MQIRGWRMAAEIAAWVISLVTLGVGAGVLLALLIARIA
jgi:hypothetical protein